MTRMLMKTFRYLMRICVMPASYSTDLHIDLRSCYIGLYCPIMYIGNIFYFKQL